ncbi:AMP-binding protein [Streptosporangium sp. NBC_01810]|uniref:AMP-binding protein n=1 Tax=Streptosporangium sp. NBC_01810 TaxID=2975951 RepID=UPI002DDA8A18|nr:AMP-binding protein [Streptosporangium sp. NBC_01810]WSA28789.1 AMP-binding protein [Streptosporangium sp. NBC_01810]
MRSDSRTLARRSANARKLANVPSGSGGPPSTFGLGKHLCIGAAPARFELRVLLEELTGRVALFASLSFDASIWEITMALLNGSALCVLDPSAMTPQETAKVISDQGVTAATFPPTFLSTLRGDELGTVRLMVVAGEQCPTGQVDGGRGRAVPDRSG